LRWLKDNLMSVFSFNKLLIFGVGLIGGSLALALRHQGATGKIIGIGRTQTSLDLARELGVIDQAIVDGDDPSHPEHGGAALAEALSDADLIVLATPVVRIEGLLQRIAPYLSPSAVVTDVGSTKTNVLAAAQRALGDRSIQFVPGHPIAGREFSGVQAALADLFMGCKVVLCPAPELVNDAVGEVQAEVRAGVKPTERIAQMWRAVGATIHWMSAARHDQVFAAVSHLPHVLSFALVEQVLRSDDPALRFAFAGGGFRDFTRIAASNPEMWRDICLANREALLAEIDAYDSVLKQLRSALEASEGKALEAVFERARQARMSLANK
jgi:prephenate dehydrogenase